MGLLLIKRREQVPLSFSLSLICEKEKDRMIAHKKEGRGSSLTLSYVRSICEKEKYGMMTHKKEAKAPHIKYIRLTLSSW